MPLFCFPRYEDEPGVFKITMEHAVKNPTLACRDYYLMSNRGGVKHAWQFPRWQFMVIQFASGVLWNLPGTFGKKPGPTVRRSWRIMIWRIWGRCLALRVPWNAEIQAFGTSKLKINTKWPFRPVMLLDPSHLDAGRSGYPFVCSSGWSDVWHLALVWWSGAAFVQLSCTQAAFAWFSFDACTSCVTSCWFSVGYDWSGFATWSWLNFVTVMSAEVWMRLAGCS